MAGASSRIPAPPANRNAASSHRLRQKSVSWITCPPSSGSRGRRLKRVQDEKDLGGVLDQRMSARDGDNGEDEADENPWPRSGQCHQHPSVTRHAAGRTRDGRAEERDEEHPDVAVAEPAHHQVVSGLVHQEHDDQDRDFARGPLQQADADKEEDRESQHAQLAEPRSLRRGLQRVDHGEGGQVRFRWTCRRLCWQRHVQAATVDLREDDASPLLGVFVKGGDRFGDLVVRPVAPDLFGGGHRLPRGRETGRVGATESLPRRRWQPGSGAGRAGGPAAGP